MVVKHGNPGKDDICHCGSCQAAWARGHKMAIDMLKADECSIWIMAVGTALQACGEYIASRQTSSQLARQMGQSDPTPFIQISIQMAAESAERIEHKIMLYPSTSKARVEEWTVFAAELEQEYNIMCDRLEADAKATAKDSPEIKKGG